MRNWIDLMESSDPAFDKWFAGSKLVDDTGAPMVFLHGTKHDFDAFRPNDLGLIFFTQNASTARSFSLVDDKTARWGVRSVRVIEAYLHATLPFDYRDVSQCQALFAVLDFDAVIKQDFARRQSNFATVSEPRHIQNLIHQGSWFILELPAVLSAIRQLGHDALYLTEYEADTIAVFSPDQVWIINK